MIFNKQLIFCYIISEKTHWNFKGPPDNLYRRRMFFNHCKYRIAGFTFTLNDILFGILRGNPKNLITRHRQFRGGDPRRSLV